MPMVWLFGVLVLGVIYGPALADLARVWHTDPYAVHGMFVPFFSAFLFWSDREHLRAVPRRSSRAGFVVILFGLGLLALGRGYGSVAIQALSVVAAVAGAVLWGFGAKWLRRAWFPVAFLLFMVPLPRAVVDASSRDLQRFAAGFAAAAAGFAGVPLYQHDVVIELPNMTLLVAEICNGLRFMMALLVLTVAFAQVSQRSRARKLVLVASAIPLAILANAMRVAAVVLLAHYWGPKAASGIIHHSIGKVVWLMTLVPLVALGLALRRVEAAGALRRRSGWRSWRRPLPRRREHAQGPSI